MKTEEERWNKPIEKATQGNRELLMTLENLSYVERKKSRYHSRHCLIILTTIYQMSETFLPVAGSSLHSPDGNVPQNGFSI